MRCSVNFVAEMLNKPQILEIVSRKASAVLGRQVGVFVVDMTQKPTGNPRMAQLVDFGKNHPDIVKIKNN